LIVENGEDVDLALEVLKFALLVEFGFLVDFYGNFLVGATIEAHSNMAIGSFA
jgi:hypothetical protein